MIYYEELVLIKGLHNQQHKMDAFTYDALVERIRCLEALLSPTFGSMPIMDQLTKLKREIDQASSDEKFQTLFKLLHEKNIWKELPVIKSGEEGLATAVNDSELILNYRNVIVASYDRFVLFLHDVENLFSMASNMDKELKLCAVNFQQVLETHSPATRYNKLVSIFSKLLVRSISLLESHYAYIQQENKNWAIFEARLINLQRQINKLEKLNLKNLQYI